ncbi:hypothetical protein AVEN_75085-1, partial [Araneus ventricosus]
YGGVLINPISSSITSQAYESSSQKRYRKQAVNPGGDSSM